MKPASNGVQVKFAALFSQKIHQTRVLLDILDGFNVHKIDCNIRLKDKPSIKGSSVIHSLSSRRFPVRTARDRYMGSNVGGASKRPSGHTCTADEFRGGEAIKHETLRTNRNFPLAPSGGFDRSTTRTIPFYNSRHAN